MFVYPTSEIPDDRNWFLHLLNYSVWPITGAQLIFKSVNESIIAPTQVKEFPPSIGDFRWPCLIPSDTNTDPLDLFLTLFCGLTNHPFCSWFGYSGL